MTVSLIRVEGLCSLTAAHVAGTLALQGRTLVDKSWRSAAAWSSLPLALSGVLDDDDATRLAWVSLRGLSEDRIALLADGVAEAHADRVRAALAERIAARRRLGDHVVLITDLPGCFAEPLLDGLGADERWTNALEVRSGRATGALEQPLVSSRLAGNALRTWCEARGTRPEHCTAFAARSSDVALLASVGHPCAVRPDRALASHARRLGWPVEVRG
ncbi:MAG: haloacid dehalogenase-like hydrolase [Myxococcota bacterium]